MKRVQQIVEQSWLNFAENDGDNEEKPGEATGGDNEAAATIGAGTSQAPGALNDANEFS